MKINKINDKRKKKIIITLILVTLLIFLGYVLYSYKYQKWPFLPDNKVKVELNSNDYTNPQNKFTSNIKIDGVDNAKNSSEVPISDTVSITIDNLRQTGQIITYSADITNYSAQGICSASFTKEGSLPVNRDDVITNNKCGPYSISANTFDSLGEWALTIRYFADDTQAIATSKIDVK